MSVGIKNIFVTALTDFSTTDLEGAGSIRLDANGNVFKWVLNDEATSVTVTQYGLACYDGAARTECKKPTTAELANRAGFWQAAVPGQQYGWIQCKGKGTGIIIRSGAASSDTVNSSAAMLSNYYGVNAQEYMTQSNALGFGGEAFSPSSLASLATTAVGTKTATLVFDFRL